MSEGQQGGESTQLSVTEEPIRTEAEFVTV